MSPGGGCFLANLDVEDTWARRAGLHPPTLSPRARTVAAHQGLLCAVLAPEADVLWTLAPVDPACRAAASGLPRPALRSGPRPAQAIGRWGQPEAFRVGHRRWAFEHGATWGTAAEDAAFIDTLQAFDAHPACAGAWVAKAPYAAAGRHRVHGHGPSPPAPTRRALERLLKAYGELLLEPWLERAADFGCAVDTGGAKIHVLHVDGRGAFAGIGPVPPGGLPGDDATRIRRVAAQVGRDLAAAGYHGPFGIDAFRYRDAEGQMRLRAVCEVNARHTFGHVAHALAPLAEAAFGPGHAWRLRCGAGRRAAAADARAGAVIVPLVTTADGARLWAWLERMDG